MSRTTLPPRGIFVPVEILFDRSLAPAIRDTWAQLRALAWGLDETPALSLEQIGKITGKRPSTIYQHMAALRNRDALRWRTSERGTVIVSFPEKFTAAKEIEPVILSDQGCSPDRRSGPPDSRFLEPSRILGKVSGNPENLSENPEKPYNSSSSNNLSPGMYFNNLRLM